MTVQPTPIYETVAMCLVAYLLWQLRDRVRPGVVFALYLVLSGLERFLVEFVRRNSEVLGGLTAPQLESIGLLVIGLVWLGLMARGSGLAACARRRASLARRRPDAGRPTPSRAGTR